MDVNADEIANLEELVGPYIRKDKKIVETRISRLTAPGENYGSTILKVDLILRDYSGKTEPLSIVAKKIPEQEFFQNLFNVQVTFKLEAAFYEIIVPTLQQFQREQGIKKVIDFFPKFYGSRNNLNGSDKVDGNAVILFENLKVSGKQTNFSANSGTQLIDINQVSEPLFENLKETAWKNCRFYTVQLFFLPLFTSPEKFANLICKLANHQPLEGSLPLLTRLRNCCFNCQKFFSSIRSTDLMCRFLMKVEMNIALLLLR